MSELNNEHNTGTRDNDDISIWEFYKDSNILITGGLGFVGKVLIEKLLRSCSDLKSINLLIRSKKGRNVQERMQLLLGSQVS